METVAEQSMKYPLSDREKFSQEFIDAVKEYYKIRNLKWPTVWEGMAWCQTEMAEVYELLLAKEGGWVRNNPTDHAAYSDEKLEEELGDAILMLTVSGIAAGVNPIESMLKKMMIKSGMVKKFSVVHLAHQLTLDVVLEDTSKFSFGLWIVRLGCIISGLRFKITNNNP